MVALVIDHAVILHEIPCIERQPEFHFVVVGDIQSNLLALPVGAIGIEHILQVLARVAVFVVIHIGVLNSMRHYACWFLNSRRACRASYL